MISVVIPAFGRTPALEQCLAGLFGSSFRQFECIVVDDGSGDNFEELKKMFPIGLIALPERRGPAYARNRGAEAAGGDILMFLDADVKPHADTVGRVADFLAAHPDVAAVFGSYDEAPADPGFFSQFKNLFHHYTHQAADPKSRTFWAGCGAVRREVFRQLGGFDERYARPSVEDIELGYRLNNRGFKVGLEKSIRVTHLKRWTFWGMVKSDVMDRALPWTALLMKEGLADDLNIRISARLSAAGVMLGLLCIAAYPLHRMAAVCGALVLLLVALGNLPLFRFFLRKRGAWFAARAIPVYLLYLLYSGAAFPIGALLHRTRLSGKERRNG